MIALALHMAGIPFRYECALILDGIHYYPDFTIRHPKTGDVYYWEHYGLMDSEEYVRSMFRKQLAFIGHGIIPGINLITTYENSEKPLYYERIEEMIDLYFG